MTANIFLYICDIRGLLKSFKITIYSERTRYGLLRHVMIRRGFTTGEVLVILVVTSPVFPSKNNFVKALLKMHPEITSVVLNVNDRMTSMVLGDRNIVLYGKGYIEDVLCNNRFRISAQSFYQINPVQTQKLYEKAVELANLTGEEIAIDAYCGIGTIGMTAASKAKTVLGIELNALAVKDAIANARANHVTNIHFLQGDAGEQMFWCYIRKGCNCQCESKSCDKYSFSSGRCRRTDDTDGRGGKSCRCCFHGSAEKRK